MNKILLLADNTTVTNIKPYKGVYFIMEITSVKIRKTFENEPLKAVMSVTFDECLAVHDVKIINAGGRYFVVMPSPKNSAGEFKDIVHPINSEFRKKLENELIEFYRSEEENRTENTSHESTSGESTSSESTLYDKTDNADKITQF